MRDSLNFVNIKHKKSASGKLAESIFHFTAAQSHMPVQRFYLVPSAPGAWTHFLSVSSLI